jgi:hypothetical protein
MVVQTNVTATAVSLLKPLGLGMLIIVFKAGTTGVVKPDVMSATSDNNSRYSVFRFRPHMETSSFFAPKDLK